VRLESTDRRGSAFLSPELVWTRRFRPLGAGQTYDTFTACGPGGSCVCASIIGGTGFCSDGQTPCSGHADCTTSDDCPAGLVCAVGSCCNKNVCIAATPNCAAGTGPGTTPARFLRRTMENDTVGNRGTWSY